MTLRNIFISIFLFAAMTSVSFAAPIRVGILKGTGPSRYWHTNIHPAGAAIATMLADPAHGNLGPLLLVPTQGFRVDMYGIDSTCSGNGCSPSEDQKNAFLNALDSLDVIFFSSYVDFGGSFNQAPQREKLDRFFKTRGVVSLHWSVDSYGSWAAWDSLHGTRFLGWAATNNLATLRRDSAAAQDPAGRLLNRGLPDTARFREEWISFTANAAAIRAVPGLKVTMSLDEASIENWNGFRAMGEHPYSWYRELPEGGRFFYTGLGHRTQLFTGAAVTDSAGDTTSVETNFLRRQLYNAILWAAGYNENTGTALGGDRTPSRFSDISRLSLSGGTLTVSLLRDGAHTVELLTLDGRRVDARHGSGRVDYVLEGLRKGTMYIVAVTTTVGRYTGKVFVP